MKARKLPQGLKYRGSILWVDVTHQGQRVRLSTDTADVGLAEATLYRTLSELKQGTYRAATKAAGASGGYTMGTAWDRAMSASWLIDATAGTVSNARSLITRLDKDGWVPFKTPVSSLDVHALATLQRELKDSGLAPSSINSRMWVIHAALEQAVRDGALTALPPFPSKLNTRSQRRTRYITRDDEARICTYLQEKGMMALLDAFVLILDTGLRHFEAVRLNADTFDAERGVVVIPGEWAKNGDTRVVPLTARAKAILTRRMGQRFEAFPVPEGAAARYWVSRFTREWATVRTALNLPESIVMHSGRHTLATRLFETGSDVRTAMSWLGHRTAAVTMEYAKGTDQSTKNAVRRLDSYVSDTATVSIDATSDGTN
jgi:integrase